MNTQQKKWEPRLLSLMRRKNYRPLKQYELLDALGLKSSARTPLRELLLRLERDGMIQKQRQGRWALAEASGELTGKISVTHQGFGFVAVEDAPFEGDIFVPRRDLNGARDGDTVVVRSNGIAAKDKPGPEGRIVKVLERGQDLISGTLVRRSKHWVILPDDGRLPKRVPVLGFASGLEPKARWKVLVKLEHGEDGDTRPEGRVIEMLGPEDEPDVEIRALMAVYGLEQEFPPEVESAAAKLDVDTDPNTLAQRLDLRQECTITIDPVDARDFDDALSLRQLDNGNWRIGIHIADVSHYVPQGEVIDEEAARRATSCYLVDRVVTMLPEDVTNRICSLVPHEDRLTHSVLVEMTPGGREVGYETAETVIHSDRRFTYEEVQEFFDTGEGPQMSKAVRSMLRTLRTLAHKLRNKRYKDGAINFNIPEIKCFLDDRGRVAELIKREQREAHQLVEEYMLLANRLVGTMLAGREVPSLFRAHEEPREAQWQQMALDLAALGIDEQPQTSRDLEAVAEAAKDHPARVPILIAVLKNLNRAEYRAEVIGHFGLAFDFYAHFTSPIRRYPDLIVHRIVKAVARGDKLPYRQKELHTLGRHCSEQEQTAEQVEKESVRIKLLRHYSDQLAAGEIGPYDGYISSIVPRGLIIELDESLMRGLLSFSDMGNEYVEVDQDGARARGVKSGKVWNIGDVLQVDLQSVDLKARQIDFALVQTQPKPKTRKKPQPKTKRKRSDRGGKRQR